MKHIFLFTALSVGALNMLGQSSKPTPVKVENLPVHALRSINNYAFNSGEKSTYRIHYGVVDAGVATISVETGDARSHKLSFGLVKIPVRVEKCKPKATRCLRV